MERLLGIALSAALAFSGPAGASVSPDVLQRTRDPDWPCIQAKVPELSAAAVWSGPPIETALQAGEDDPEVAALAAELAQRRMPIEDATAAIKAFAAGLDPAVKEERLTRLFAETFATLNRERAEVMEGIGRYARKQKALAEEIRQATARLQDPNAAAADPQQSTILNDQVIWQTRIFNERRAALTFVCEVPTLIEQRLFALARAIGAEMPE